MLLSDDQLRDIVRQFLVRRVAAGRFGANIAAPSVESRRSNLEKLPWKMLDPLDGPIESGFLRPLYLGESLAPYRLLEPVEAIIPWDTTSHRLIDSEAARLANHSHLARWLEQAEEIWASNRRDAELSLINQLDFYGKLRAQFPIAPFRVIYSASGKIPAAAILRDQTAIIEHKLYWIGTVSLGEGRFMLAILNSETTRARVAPDQSRGQWGARDFDKLLAEAIPQFDPKNRLHLDRVNAAAEAEKIAGRIALPEDIHFIRARKLIRDALKAEGIAQRIDALVTRLLGNG